MGSKLIEGVVRTTMGCVVVNVVMDRHYLINVLRIIPIVLLLALAQMMEIVGNNCRFICNILGDYDSRI